MTSSRLPAAPAPGAGLVPPAPAARGRRGREPGVGVVVPARDEEELLAACLEGVGAAAAALGPGEPVPVVVVLDDCRDASRAVTLGTDAGWRRRGVPARITLVEVSERNVGAARAAGFAALGRAAPDPGWLATTDADSVVPEHWLAHQMELYRGGADAWLGTVTLAALAGQALPGPAGELRRGRAHEHVHGANLGVRAGAYSGCGGFSALATGEDADLARRLRAGGWRVIAGRGAPVLTSGRTQGRAPGGFAADRAAGRTHPAVPAVSSRAAGRASR